MRSCQPCPPIYTEQHFFLHLLRIGCKVFIPGQVAIISPYGRADRDKRRFCILHRPEDVFRYLRTLRGEQPAGEQLRFFD